VSPPRSLFIVNRFLPSLHDHLCAQFGAEPGVDVVLDRRMGERRADLHRVRRVWRERRSGERRRNTRAQEDLRTMGYAFVRAGLGGERPAGESEGGARQRWD
jgi:hypothetical protein